MLILTSILIIIGAPLFFIWLHNGIGDMQHHSVIIDEAQDSEKRFQETARQIVEQNQRIDRKVDHEWPDLDEWDIHHIYKSL